MNSEIVNSTTKINNSHKLFWRWNIGIDVILLFPYSWIAIDSVSRFFSGLSIADYGLLKVYIVVGVFFSYLMHCIFLLGSLIYYLFKKEYRVCIYLVFYTVLIGVLTLIAQLFMNIVLAFGTLETLFD